MQSYCWKSLYVFLIVAAAIFIYRYAILYPIFGKQKKMIKKDPLNWRVFNMGEDCCSSWPLSHFALYCLMGYFFPCCDLLIISIGVVWELIETALSYLLDDSEPISGKDLQYKYWWAGSFKDIMFNVLGFYTGKLIAIVIAQKTCKV